MTRATKGIVQAIVEALLEARLTEEQATELFQQGQEAVVFTLMTTSKELASKQDASASPSKPSGMVAPYEKPTISPRRKRPGGRLGHRGSRRKTPEHIDQHKEHRLDCCPDCQGPLKRCKETRTRYVEDIPEDMSPVVTEHTVHRDWCPQCGKRVEPRVTDALPKATLGNRTLVLSAWLHYALGNTLSQILEVFNHHLQLKLSHGGLVQMWYRLQRILFAWYMQIQTEALSSAVLHGDETGWRVNGKTHWLWCFSNRDVTYYMIDRSRGSPALAKFFQEEFDGTLISDFWGAYNAVVCSKRQKCLVHLLRELARVEQYGRPGESWGGFAKKLRRLLADAIRLWKREQVPEAEHRSRRVRLDRRLSELIDTPWEDAHARRLIKRLRRHQQDLFTFLDEPGVPFENNHAERAIRPAVIIRKNSYANRSHRGADTQAVLMSVYRTLKQRHLDPIATVTEAIATYLRTGHLPPLPSRATADG